MKRTATPISSAFSWVREPDFNPPGKDGGAVACLMHEFATPRAGELKTLLETYLESIIIAVNAAAGVVRLLSPDGRTLQIISSAGLLAEMQDDAAILIELDCAFRDNARLSNQAHATDISRCGLRPCCRHNDCRFQSLIAIPLEPANTSAAPLGILTIFFETPRETAVKSMNILETFSVMVCASIEHTHINREARRMELLAERHVLANEIHDSLAQTLTYSRMRVSLLLGAIQSGDKQLAMTYAQDLDEVLEIGQKSARELVTDFRCEMHPGGLSAALLDITAEFGKRNDIVIEYHNRLIDLELPLEYEIQVYNIVREALSNISRHSGATHARIFVDERFGYYIFTIEDNGSGACTFTPVEGHYGMLIMRERAHRIGGTIKVESAAGLGTQLQLFFLEPSSDWRALNE